jgi:hypothetical protein
MADPAYRAEVWENRYAEHIRPLNEWVDRQFCRFDAPSGAANVGHVASIVLVEHVPHDSLGASRVVYLHGRVSFEWHTHRAERNTLVALEAFLEAFGPHGAPQHTRHRQDAGNVVLAEKVEGEVAGASLGVRVTDRSNGQAQDLDGLSASYGEHSLQTGAFVFLLQRLGQKCDGQGRWGAQLGFIRGWSSRRSSPPSDSLF